MSATDWQGRRLHFLGIGGSGMSGLARIALQRGAQVSGSDRAESSATLALQELGAAITIGHDPAALPSSPLTVVRSTAITDENPELAAARGRGDEVLHRSELLAQLVGDRRTIAVAGAHGKTTTSAMIAHVLQHLGLEPSWVIGGTVRSLDDLSAQWGSEDGWLVVEADESDRSFLRLHPTIPVVTNIELDHDARDLGALEADFTQFLAGSAQPAVLPSNLARVVPELGEAATLVAVPAGDPLRGVPYRAQTGAPLTIRLAVPGSHNAGNAALAIEALSRAGVDPAAAAEALASFVGAGRRFEPLGESTGGARVVDDYAHHPTEVAATIEAARAWVGEGRVIAVFQPHLFSRTRDFAEPFAEALAAADEAILVPIYPARERQEDFPEVSSATITARWPWHAVAEARLVDGFDEAVGLAAQLGRPGDVIIVMGAGDVRRVGERLASGEAGHWDDEPDAAPDAADLPAGVSADHPLDRMTTVRAGGRADYFARVSDADAVVALLQWASERGVPVHAIGSGSNLLVADDGVRGLVLRLDGELGSAAFDGQRLVAGGGARFPQAAAAAARLGLAGIEFGVSIPGTVGGAVRMNANAYGGALAETLEWVEVATVDGVQRRAPGELGFSYRHSALRDGEIVLRAAFNLQAAEPERVKADLAELRERRKATQPSGIKTFGSTFKNPPPWPEGPTAGQLLDQAGCRGLTHGAARLSPKHANFVENTGDATTREIIELMQLARERVHAAHGIWLEPEVQVLGVVDLPWATAPAR